MRIRYTRRAQADLCSYGRYLQARSPRGAAKVRESIRRAIQILQRFPELGVPQPRYPGVRKFVAPPYGYIIFYGVDRAADVIDVLTIQYPAAQPEFGDT